MERARRSPEPVIRMVAHSRHDAQLLADLHDRALVAGRATRSVLLELDGSRQHMRPTSGAGFDALPAEPWLELPESLALAFELLASGHPRQVAPLATVLPDLACRIDSPAAILAPVIAQGHGLGLLVLAVPSVTPPLEWIDDVAACADGLALTLARARLEHDAARRRDADALTLSLAGPDGGEPDVEQCERFCRDAARIFAADRVAFWRHDRAARRVSVVAASDGSQRRRPAVTPTDENDAWLVKALRASVVSVVPLPSGRGANANAVVPLRGQRRALGVLVFQGLHVPPGDESRLSESLTRLGHGVSAVIEGRQLLENVLRARRMADLSHLMAGIAHELNNPLQAVLGHLELTARGGRIPAPLARTLRLVHQEAERASRIVRNLLLLGGEGRLTLRPVSASRALSRALTLRAAECRRLGITVRRSIATSLPSVRGDAVLLQQAFHNILLNAEQAIGGTPGGRIDVNARLRRDRLVVEIRDNGPGLAADIAGRLFEPFVTTREGGSGLGLAITARIVREFGGEVTAAAREGGGAVFTVSLPVVT